MSLIKQLERYENVSPLLRKYFKPNLKTNHFMTEEEYRFLIAEKSLYYYEWDGGIIFLKKREADFKLTYQLIDLEAQFDFEGLREEISKIQDLPVVMEIVQRPNDKTSEEVELFWKKQGFESCLERMQMNLQNDEGTNSSETNQKENESSNCVVRFCNITEKDFVSKMLHEYFNIHTGCIPSGVELAEEIKNNRIIGAFVEENKLVGLLHLGIKKMNAEIRHLVVAKEVRNQGVASRLIKKYHTEIVQKRANLWVTHDNETAQNFYKKNGYEFDRVEVKSFNYID